MEKSTIKNYIRRVIYRIPGLMLINLYHKPRLIIELLINPSRIYNESYFPELKHKGRVEIFIDQIINILKYCAVDEYYYMYGLDVKRNIKNCEYVNYREFSIVRDRLNLSNQFNDSSILRNKLFFEGIASSLGIPTPKNIAYIDNGLLSILHHGKVKQVDWSDFTKYVTDRTLYIKPLDGQCGTGITKIDIQGGSIFLNDRKISNLDLKVMCKLGKYLVQATMIQHSEMSRIYPNSVNTIRLTTVRNIKTGEIEVLPPTLRIGAHGSIVDNFSKGGVIVAMDTESGNLDEWGFFKPKYGFKSRMHPDTKVEFRSFHVPYYKEAKRMAIYFHSFLNLHSIGWDIAISQAGPVFIEGNDNWEINLPQTFKNPFRKEFERLFSLK